MDYYQKYLKYKHKYLNLKGGAICHKDPYHQHQGECWHDSVLAIFTYTDKLNDKVQTKLLELYNVDKDKMIENITKYLENNNHHS